MQVVKTPGKRREGKGRPRCYPKPEKLKVLQEFPPELGIETILPKQSIVTISILHTLEILEFERG